jgi:pimeloyl-ACP methyl ester carboxylesterase
MAVFVLVHGANLGGWCWDAVRSRLERQGHSVLTPTLPDDGDPPPTLAAQIDFVAGFLNAEDLRNIVLVGHSYAGMIVTGVADQVAGRIAHLVYLDAAVPSDGDDFASWVPGLTTAEAESRRAFFRGLSSDGIWLPPPPLVGITDPTEKATIAPRLVRHPLETWLEPIRLTNCDGGVPKTYVVATSPPTGIMGYPRFAEAARQRDGWTVREIHTGHAMMLTAPDATTDLLLEAAGE